MVLSTRSASLFERPRYQPTRSLALAVAILINALVLLKLSLPSQPLPMTQPLAEAAKTDVIVIERQPIEPVVPPPPAPMAPVRPAANPAPVAVAATAPITASEPVTVVVESSVLPAAPAPGLVAEPAAPLASAAEQITIAYGPRPLYPPPALRRNLQGTVVLSILVGVDGLAQEVRVQQGSGHRILDQAALKHVRAHWRFNPAQRGGRSIEAWASVPIDFRIAD